MRIGLVYIQAKNLGDIVIYDAVRFLVEKALAEQSINDYEMIPINMARPKGDEGETNLSSAVKKTSCFFDSYLEKVLKSRTFAKALPNIAKRLLVSQWHKTTEYSDFKRLEMGKLQNLDLIIFVGGGIIKYHEQKFPYFIDCITAFAEENGIPVFINAAGVEGYDESSLECGLLKEAINRKCVKFISTRDDYDTLVNRYIVNHDIVLGKVCDPALWASDCYRLGECYQKPQKIGINVIRADIFGKYLYAVNKKRLGEMYYQLIKKLLANGYHVEFFTNGFHKDARFIAWLFDKYPDLRQEERITVVLPETAEQLVQTISQFERFIGVRLHASIIGCALGVPNVNLVWNQKQIMFGQQIGLPDNYVTRENFTTDYVYEKLVNAKEYTMDIAYKYSIYNGLSQQLRKVIDGVFK